MKGLWDIIVTLLHSFHIPQAFFSICSSSGADICSGGRSDRVPNGVEEYLSDGVPNGEAEETQPREEADAYAVLQLRFWFVCCYFLSSLSPFSSSPPPTIWDRDHTVTSEAWELEHDHAVFHGGTGDAPYGYRSRELLYTQQ